MNAKQHSRVILASVLALIALAAGILLAPFVCDCLRRCCLGTEEATCTRKVLKVLCVGSIFVVCAVALGRQQLSLAKRHVHAVPQRGRARPSADPRKTSIRPAVQPAVGVARPKPAVAPKNKAEALQVRAHAAAGLASQRPGPLTRD